MGACLKKVTGKGPVEATANDVANAIGLANFRIKDNVPRRLVVRVLESAGCCDFAKLESLVANLHQVNKGELKCIILMAGLAFWNPATNSEYRFWD